MSAQTVLGRGLRSLIPEKAEQKKGPKILDLHLSLIEANVEQPRKDFDAKALRELVFSIKEHGVLQPILVRKKGERYEIIAGERRFRASKQLGLPTIPAIVKEADEQRSSYLALIENIQRSDLSPVEKANAYQKCLDEFECTQEELAQSLGIERSTLTNTLRVLGLPQLIQDKLSERAITFGHAKILMGLPSAEEQLELLNQFVSEGLSVRKAEEHVREFKGKKKPVRAKTPKGSAKSSSQGAGDDPHLQELQDRFREALGTKVLLNHNWDKGKGSLVIEYYSLDDLSRLVEVITEPVQS